MEPREAVDRWLNEMLAGQRELQAVMEDAFQELGAAVEDWRKIQAEREAGLRDRESALAQREQELAASLARYREAQEELARLREQTEIRAAEVERRARELQAREEEWQRRLLQTGDHEKELARLRELVSELRAAAQPVTATSSSEQTISQRELAHWQQKVEDLEKQLAEVQRQKDLLEAEVSILRHRAMEWLEMLADQRRQLIEERNRWAGEIRQFRRLIEVLLDRHVEPLPEGHEEHESAAPRVIPYEPLEARLTGTGDAFLDSLSAQFEQLRKEFDHRRGKVE
jgi:DNA repair exonuclease SbcCD ATPase subunit